MDWPGHKRQRSTLRLYRNNRNGTFTDVTRAAGLDVELYGMGVAVGDFNNDGFPDIFVTCVGQNRLFRNTGKGTFRQCVMLFATPWIPVGLCSTCPCRCCGTAGSGRRR